MNCKFILLTFFFPFVLGALEEQPWFGDVYEFNFISKYAYSRYSAVDGTISPLEKPSHDHLLYFDLEFPYSPYWSINTDIQFIDTPRQTFSFSAFAIQARYLHLDDIVGDPITLATGFSGRFISDRSLRDISSLYHGNVDLEVNISVGKELEGKEKWQFRLWGFGALGIANLGSIWLRGKVALEGNYCDTQRGSLFLKASHGYGSGHKVDIKKFRGYGRLRYRFIDVALRYSYKLGVWGTIRIQYQRRILAKLGPKKVNTFAISYLLPFSY